MNRMTWRVALVVAVGLVMVQAGCSHAPSANATGSTALVTRRVLSPDSASGLAARLANDRCEQLYRKRPFRPEQYSAVLQQGMYRWGGLDVGGPAGYSALVTFREDGTEPRVELYFSSDKLNPPAAR